MIALMSGALTMLLPLLLLGTVTAAICNAGVASNFEGAGSANCCGCCTALTCVCVVICPPMVVIGGLWSIQLLCCIVVSFLDVLLNVADCNSTVFCHVAWLTTSVAACCVSFPLPVAFPCPFPFPCA